MTTADLASDKGGGLSDAAVDRLLGGPATSFNLTTEDFNDYDNAIKNEVSIKKDAPSILGVQVDRVPWWLQIVYMVGVVVAMCYVVMLAVNKLMARDKEKEERRTVKKNRLDRARRMMLRNTEYLAGSCGGIFAFICVDSFAE